MNFDFRVEFSNQAILQGAVKLSADNKVTPVHHYASDPWQRDRGEWIVKANVTRRDRIFLRYSLKKPDNKPVRLLPLVIHGVTGTNEPFTSHHTVTNIWQDFTISLGNFRLDGSSTEFSTSVLAPTAELPGRVAKFLGVSSNKKSNNQERNTTSFKGGSPPLLGAPPTAYQVVRPNAEAISVNLGVEPPTKVVGTPFYPVWYATNREPVLVDTKLVGYSANQIDTVSYGECYVDIPRGHRIGRIDSTFWRRLALKLIGREDDQALKLKLIKPLEALDYWAAIQQQVAQWQPDSRCALLFLHGYNVSFAQAAIRAAQIGYDLKVQGPVGFFSWPSLGDIDGYGADEAAIQSSEIHIARFLLDFAQNSGAERVHIIAHSMGNLGLLRSIQRIVGNVAADAPKLFTHFILAAPDVDQRMFLELAGNYNQVAKHTTLYVSDRDKALKASKMLRKDRARAGLTPPITIVQNIDTVHVANIDLTLLGHGYVAGARDVLSDINQLISFNAPPEQRSGLLLAKEGDKDYWVIGS